MSAPPTDPRWASSWIPVGTFAIAAFILASAFAGASGPDGRVHGLVTDSVSGGPIGGATGRIEASGLPWGFEATTDSTGYYEGAVPAHRYSVTALGIDPRPGALPGAPGSGHALWGDQSAPTAGGP